ncbi:MAG TPA: corrinoid protein [bacterium]|nr:corrinoid protein [bacterium]
MNLLEDIKNAIDNMEPELTAELVGKAEESGIAPMDIVEKGLIPGIQIVGEKFKSFEYFLPEVIMAAKAFKTGFEIILPKLLEAGYEPKGKILIGTVAGDNHDIGKNIVIALLRGNGYDVHDAGVDVPPDKFVQLVREVKPDVIGMSALLTTTMAQMRDTISAIQKAGLRDSVKIIVGGSCLSSEFALKIGADGYGEDAPEAVALVEKLLSA